MYAKFTYLFFRLYFDKHLQTGSVMLSIPCGSGRKSQQWRPSRRRRGCRKLCFWSRSHCSRLLWQCGDAAGTCAWSSVLSTWGGEGLIKRDCETCYVSRTPHSQMGLQLDLKAWLQWSSRSDFMALCTVCWQFSFLAKNYILISFLEHKRWLLLTKGLMQPELVLILFI